MKESRIFEVEILIFVRFVIGSVYTVYGRYYENLPNFDVILEKCVFKRGLQVMPFRELQLYKVTPLQEILLMNLLISKGPARL